MQRCNVHLVTRGFLTMWHELGRAVRTYWMLWVGDHGGGPDIRRAPYDFGATIILFSSDGDSVRIYPQGLN
jgi:hypothetical protein